jgi:RND family efflux transporter MFP subunit
MEMTMTLPPCSSASLRLALLSGALVLAGPALAQDKAAGDSFDCLIQPMAVLRLGTPVPGLVQEVLFDRGATVKKGDIVARLQSGVEEANAAVAKARAENDAAVKATTARLDYARRRAERLTQLRRNDNVAIGAADEAETAARVAESEQREAEVVHRLAELEFRRASEVVNQRTIVSPVDGIVTERTMGPGEYANDWSSVMTVAQLDPLRVEARLPLGMYRSVQPGMTADVTPDKPVEGVYPAKVSVVDRVFDSSTGTVGVRLELSNPGHLLPAGLKCKLRFRPTG